MFPLARKGPAKKFSIFLHERTKTKHQYRTPPGTVFWTADLVSRVAMIEAI
jgi:hypothetical protein